MEGHATPVSRTPDAPPLQLRSRVALNAPAFKGYGDAIFVKHSWLYIKMMMFFRVISFVVFR